MSKEDILISLKEIHARYCIPASEQNYTDKDYACMQYEKLVIYLSNQLDKQKEVINKIKEYIKNTEELYLVENYEEEGLMTPIKNIKELLEEIE